jgi:DNA-binding CsgD family transcriptional regulator
MSTERALAAALDLAAAAGTVDGAADLPRAVWPALAALVGGDSLAATGFDGRPLSWPAGAVPEAAFAAFARCAATYPLAVRTREAPGVPLRASDVASSRELAGGAARAEVFRDLGVRHQVALVVGRDGTEACVALNRAGRDFTDRDVALLRLVRPHLAEALWRAAHGSPPRRLTPRERAVVARVARGATDAAIARELGISRRTVGKHLENAYAALGVRDRTSAAVRLAGPP